MAKSDSTPHRVALYARVSTKNNGQDPSTHLLAVCELCVNFYWLLQTGVTSVAQNTLC